MRARDGGAQQGRGRRNRPPPSPPGRKNTTPRDLTAAPGHRPGREHVT